MAGTSSFESWLVDTNVVAALINPQGARSVKASPQARRRIRSISAF